VAHDLQQDEAPDEPHGGKRHERTDDQRAPIEHALLAPLILDAHGGHG
jgi:hypothetical protein